MVWKIKRIAFILIFEDLSALFLIHSCTSFSAGFPKRVCPPSGGRYPQLLFFTFCRINQLEIYVITTFELQRMPRLLRRCSLHSKAFDNLPCEFDLVCVRFR
jgi:hypothetical protein